MHVVLPSRCNSSWAFGWDYANKGISSVPSMGTVSRAHIRKTHGSQKEPAFLVALGKDAEVLCAVFTMPSECLSFARESEDVEEVRNGIRVLVGVGSVATNERSGFPVQSAN